MNLQQPDLEGRYTVDGLGRIYSNNDDIWLPSVSTVISTRETPEALQRWKQRTDNHKQVQAYKQAFGTLAHEQCLQDITPVNTATDEPVTKLWGKEEDEARAQLEETGDWERAEEELEWVAETWDLIKLVANIDAVIDVETFVANTDIGYAGQFDLLYQDQETDETVLADLKTSKDVYEKHLLQLTAYRMAVELPIDRMEVIRINPEKRDWEIVPDSEWEYDIDHLESEFIRLRGQLEKQNLKTILDTVQDASDQIDSETDVPSVDADGIIYEPVS